VLERLRQRARALKRDTFTLYFAARDPRTPWYARALTLLVVAYALSPIDLIPDFIPVLGYLDDLVLVPAGLALAVRLVPHDVLAECRAQALARSDRPISRAGALLVVGVWLVVALLLVRVLFR
jgi:uncharacterized membrane protein YkvA (DUF1232 family)